MLAEHLALLRAAHVPRIVIKCLFKQVIKNTAMPRRDVMIHVLLVRLATPC